MGSRLGRRVVYFANLPIKLLMPTSFTNITEIALKTIPSASKIEIKRVLESLYGFDVEKVETLNREGKKRRVRGGMVVYKPDYKKAYVTLRSPLSINPELFPIQAVQEDKSSTKKELESSIVEDPDAVKRSHWMEEKRDGGRVNNSWTHRRRFVGGQSNQRSPRKRPEPAPAPAKFPWSSMRGFGK